jgi:ferrous iron transport protein A
MPQTAEAVRNIEPKIARADKTLDALVLGHKATVRAIEGELPTRRRLLEMGLCEGVEIEAVRFAPLGDPIEFRVRGYFISLRASQARHIRIAPLS